MLRFLLILAVFLNLFEVPAQAWPVHGIAPPASQTPVLQAQEVVKGALVRINQGGVPLDFMKAPSSPPVQSWIVTQTKGTNGYWSATTSGQTQNELIPIANPTATLSSGGAAYTVGDVLTLSNGAVVTVSGVSHTIITAFTKTSAPSPVVTNLQGSGAGGVTVVSCTTGPCTGSGATFTYTYNTLASTPVPTSTGQNNNLGGNATVMDAFEFSVVAVGFDGSHSAPKTLQYDLAVDSAEVSSSVSGTFANTAIFGYGTGSGTTNTIQAFVNGCANCSGSTGDMKLLVSTGSVFANPNLGPNHDAAYQLGVGNLNIGAAITSATWSGATPTPSYTNLLTIEDASRALGTGTPAPSTVGALSTFEDISIAGTGFVGNTCDMTHGATAGTTYLDLVGLTIGGAPLYNNLSTAPAGITYIDTCDVWQENDSGIYSATYTAGLLTYAAAGNLSNVVAIGASNQNLTINYLTCVNASGCWIDIAASLATASSNVVFNHVWARDYNQNAFTRSWSSITCNDCWNVGPFIYPGSNSHVDNVQIDDGTAPINDTFNRIWMVAAEGDASTQGAFGGNYATASGAIVGSAIHGGVFFGNSYTFNKDQSCDSTGSQVCGLTAITAIRQNPGVPGLNGAAAYSLTTFSTTQPPSDGLTFVVGQGCSPAAAITGGAQCTQPGFNYVQFCYTVSDSNCNPAYHQIIIPNGASTTGAQALTALKAALGYSSNNSVCDHPTALGLAVMICVGVTNPDGSSNSAEIISTLDPVVNYTVATTLTFVGTGVSTVNSPLELVGQLNTPKAPKSGPGLQFDYAVGGVAATCTAPSIKWCGGPYVIDKVYVQDAATASTPSSVYNLYYTPAALQTALGSTYFNVTQNNIFGADDTTSGGPFYLYSLFTTDGVGGTGATAESNAEIVTWLQYLQKTPIQICQFYSGIIIPSTAGKLTATGNTNLTATVSAMTTGGVWNEGSGKDPCWDIGVGSQYAVNPYPH